MNNIILFIGINNIIMLIPPKKLPNITLFIETFLFNIIDTPRSNKKSKKKLINITRSRYTFI